MKVLKRDKTTELFQFSKIENAIGKAFKACGFNLPLDALVCIKKFYNESEDCTVKVNDIQDNIERCLMTSYPDVAKAYIIYRYEHKVIRETKNKLIKGIEKKLRADNVENQNANVDEYSFGGRIGEASRYVTKNYALDYGMSRMARKNHLENMVYIHDLDSYEVGCHNCLTLPIDDLLRDGFNTRQTDVRKANSINTAFQLLAVLFQLQSLQQFGGVSASHLDWSMVPYVRKSFYKHYLDGLKYIEDVSYSKEEWDRITEGRTINDEYFKENKKVYAYALDMTEKELNQAVEGMYHNLN